MQYARLGKCRGRRHSRLLAVIFANYDLNFEFRMRNALLQLALLAALAGAAQAALAKAPAKKNAHGAIAVQRETGRVGYVFEAATSRAAKTEALKQCADARCEVVSSFSNACGSLARDPARGPKGYFPATGATRQEAETKALRLCARNDCDIVAWACTK
jgi:hypothetical protein